MRFDYTGVISASADTGDPIVIFRPEVRIRVHGPAGSGDFLALVDTGADNTILPESVARPLGIPVVPGQGPAARAFGGQEISLSYADIELELVHAEGAGFSDKQISVGANNLIADAAWRREFGNLSGVAIPTFTASSSSDRPPSNVVKTSRESSPAACFACCDSDRPTPQRIHGNGRRSA